MAQFGFIRFVSADDLCIFVLLNREFKNDISAISNNNIDHTAYHMEFIFYLILSSIVCGPMRFFLFSIVVDARHVSRCM